MRNIFISTFIAFLSLFITSHVYAECLTEGAQDIILVGVWDGFTEKDEIKAKIYPQSGQSDDYCILTHSAAIVLENNNKRGERYLPAYKLSRYSQEDVDDQVFDSVLGPNGLVDNKDDRNNKQGYLAVGEVSMTWKIFQSTAWQDGISGPTGKKPQWKDSRGNDMRKKISPK